MASEEEIRKRLDHITEIFSSISDHASVQSSSRCPYRDRNDLCTAKFRCHNQSQLTDGELSCTHGGSFDYRSAWESNPAAVEHARDKVSRVRKSAQQRRAAAQEDGESGASD